MADYTWNNIFDSESFLMEVDPMYMRTAEYADMLYEGTPPELADLEMYVEARWLDTYKWFLQEAIENGRVELDRRTQEVPCPAAAKVTDCWLERLEAAKRDDVNHRGLFHLDAIMAAEIDIFQATVPNEKAKYRELIEKGTPLKKSHVRQWYRIRGYLDISGRETDIAHSIMVYDMKDKRTEHCISDTLVPIISRTELEGEAEGLLLRNKMKAEVEQCCRVNSMKLASSMGLTVKDVCLSRSGRILGELYLHDAFVKYYRKDGVEDYIEVHPGTILYDSAACGTLEKIDETIIHECVHYDEHFLFYSLQREYNDCIKFLASVDRRYEQSEPEDVYERRLEDGRYIEYNVEEKQDDSEWTDIEWVEWQARELTTRIRMPANQTRLKIRQLIQKYSGNEFSYLTDIYTRVIPELAEFYGVSMTTAKKRMEELGYTDIQGIGNCVDGVAVPAYMTSTGEFKQGTTYVISKADAEKLYTEDAAFAAIIDTETFVYTEGHYCFDKPGYTYRDKDGIHLTQKARQEIDKCCLLFTVGYRRTESAYDKEAFHSDACKEDPIAKALAAIPIDVLLEKSSDMTKLVAGLPVTFGETLKHHRKEKKLTQEGLAEMLGVERETVIRYETAKKPPITKQMIARIGVELCLHGIYTEDMMKKANQSLETTDEKDNALRFVIYFMFMRKLEECNEYLASRKCLPLGSRKQRSQAC